MDGATPAGSRLSANGFPPDAFSLDHACLLPDAATAGFHDAGPLTPGGRPSSCSSGLSLNPLLPAYGGAGGYNMSSTEGADAHLFPPHNAGFGAAEAAFAGPGGGYYVMKSTDPALYGFHGEEAAVALGVAGSTGAVPTAAGSTGSGGSRGRRTRSGPKSKTSPFVGVSQV